MLWEKKFMIMWVRCFWSDLDMWSVWAENEWLGKCTGLRWSVKRVETRLARGSWTELRRRAVRSRWSWETQRWKTRLQNTENTLWKVQMPVWMYQNWPNTFSTMNSEGIDSNERQASQQVAWLLNHQLMMVEYPTWSWPKLHDNCTNCFRKGLHASWECARVVPLIFL